MAVTVFRLACSVKLMVSLITFSRKTLRSSFSYKSKDEENGFLGMYKRRTREIRKLVEKLGDKEDKREMEAAIADVYRKVDHRHYELGTDNTDETPQQTSDKSEGETENRETQTSFEAEDEASLTDITVDTAGSNPGDTTLDSY